MQTEIVIIIVLVIVIAAQQFFFMRHIHRLLDKLMSRSYTEYIRADKPIINKPFKLDEEPAEDLNAIEDIHF